MKKEWVWDKRRWKRNEYGIREDEKMNEYGIREDEKWMSNMG